MTEDLSHFPAAATSRIATDRPGRYGKQLANHMGRKLTATWDDETHAGQLIFNRGGQTSGYLIMSAEDNTLVLELFAEPEHSERLKDVVASHLVRFGAKDELQVAWTSST